jgi:hypothetical protein
VRDKWAEITDETGREAYPAGNMQTQKFMRKLQG